VNCVVPRETLGGESSDGSNDGLDVFGNLVFNDCMENSMSLQVGQLDLGSAVVFLNKPNAGLFIERKPLLGNWGVIWIVAFHGASFTGAKISFYASSIPEGYGSPGEGTCQEKCDGLGL